MCFAVVLGQRLQVGDRQFDEAGVLMDHRHELTVLRNKCCTEGLGPRENSLQSPCEAFKVQVASDAEGSYQIIGGVPGFELIKKPQPLLRKRGRSEERRVGKECRS